MAVHVQHKYIQSCMQIVDMNIDHMESAVAKGLEGDAYMLSQAVRVGMFLVERGAMDVQASEQTLP